jgi:hypothetical protein
LTALLGERLCSRRSLKSRGLFRQAAGRVRSFAASRICSTRCSFFEPVSGPASTDASCRAHESMIISNRCDRSGDSPPTRHPGLERDSAQTRGLAAGRWADRQSRRGKIPDSRGLRGIPQERSLDRDLAAARRSDGAHVANSPPTEIAAKAAADTALDHSGRRLRVAIRRRRGVTWWSVPPARLPLPPRRGGS